MELNEVLRMGGIWKPTSVTPFLEERRCGNLGPEFLVKVDVKLP